MKKVLLLWAALVFPAMVFAGETDTLELPFFDDFSYLGSEPDGSLWKNSGCGISRYMAKNPPSTGVLVFDALDSFKNFYPNAYYGNFSAGDTIESRPINLNYPNDKTVFLSFYFQAGGNGDYPEKQDSLCLDFFSPLTNQWSNIRQYSGANKNSFKQEMINITEKEYLQKGFKFRFRNYFSLGSESQKDLVGDCDFWFVDYVKLDRNRMESDTVYSDVSLTGDPVIKFGDYTSVPWKHYQNDTRKMPLSYSVFYRNNDKKARLLDSINLTLNGEKFALGSYNMPSYMDFENHNKDFNYVFSSKSDTIMDCDITVKLVSDVTKKDFPNNNEVSVKKTFLNYYAYDDGTAEAAYGLYGEGSQGGLAAVRFVALTPDVLTGVYMYFCPVFQNAQADYFNIKVFNCKNGKPLVEIYSQNNVAVPKNETEKFVFFEFKNPVQIADTFFIGWEKLSKDIIAMGFDKNTEKPNNKFFNLNGEWKLSKEKGQIMLRPAFGALKTATLTDIMPKTFEVKLYPNPANDFFYIDMENSKCKRISIYNLNGQKVKSAFVEGGLNEINVNDLKNGMYIIDFEEIKMRKKLLITH